MNRRRRHRSLPPLFYEGLELWPGDGAFTGAISGNFLLQSLQPYTGSFGFIKTRPTLGYNAGNGFFMTGDDNFLTSNYAPRSSPNRVFASNAAILVIIQFNRLITSLS